MVTVIVHHPNQVSKVARKAVVLIPVQGHNHHPRLVVIRDRAAVKVVRTMLVLSQGRKRVLSQGRKRILKQLHKGRDNKVALSKLPVPVIAVALKAAVLLAVRTMAMIPLVIYPLDAVR